MSGILQGISAITEIRGICVSPKLFILRWLRLASQLHQTSVQLPKLQEQREIGIAKSEMKTADPKGRNVGSCSE